MKSFLFISLLSIQIICYTDIVLSKGIAFAGGGFRAQAVASGVVTGLLSASDKDTKALFENIEDVSGNSGGVWFTAQLLYSKNFVKLLEDIAKANHKDSINLFQKGWVDKFLKASGVPRIYPDTNMEIMKAVQALLKRIDDELVAWAGMIVHYFIAHKVDWTYMIDTMMASLGDLDTKQTLQSAPVNDWAIDKKYAVAAALVMPQQNVATFGMFEKPCKNKLQTARSVAYSYTNDRQSLKGPVLPVTFSASYMTKDGGDVHVDAPFPFMNTSQMDLQYTLQTASTPVSLGDPIKTQKAHLSGLGPGMHNNQVPIKDVVSTSSAFLSQMLSIYEKIQTEALVLNGLHLWNTMLGLVIPASLSPDTHPEEMFSTAANVMKRQKRTCDEMVHDLAEYNVMTVTDGGYVDNTAVSYILSNAQDGDSYTLILNDKDTAKYQNIRGLFRGAYHGLATYIPVFNEDQAYVTEQLKSIKKLKTMSGTKNLIDIQYGTIEANTIDAPDFGVTAGKRIKLNLIMVTSKMLIAPLHWDEMPILVAEIKETMSMSENKEQMQTILNYLS